MREHAQNSNFGCTTATLAHFLRRVPLLRVIVIDAIAVIVVVIRLQRLNLSNKCVGNLAQNLRMFVKLFKQLSDKCYCHFYSNPAH